MSEQIYIFLLWVAIVVLVSALWRAWYRCWRIERARAGMEDSLGLERERTARLLIAQAELEERGRVPVPSGAATLLTDERFCAVWREVREEDPLYLAMRMFLARETVAQVDRVADPRLAGKPGEMAHAAGGLDWAITLGGNLEAVRRHPEQWCAGAAPASKVQSAKGQARREGAAR